MSFVAGTTYSVLVAYNQTTAGTYPYTVTIVFNGPGCIAINSHICNNYTATGRAAGGAAVGMGTALDAIAASNSVVAQSFQTSVLTPLAALPQTEQQTAIRQLAPSQIAPSTLSAVQGVEAVTATNELHMLSLASGGGAGMAAGSAQRDTALWGQVLGGGAIRGTNAQADGYRANNFGLISGIDYQLGPNTLVGVAASWVKGWAWGSDSSSGSLTTTNAYQITGYGLQRWDNLFVDGQLGVGYITYDQRRAINYLGTAAHANYDGQQYLAKLGTGYDFPMDGFTVTPMGGIRFLRVVSDGYTETGAGAANLTVERRGVQSLTQDIGAKVSWDVQTSVGLLKPDVRLAWVHDYTTGPIATSGIMGGTTFTSTTARPSADGAKLVLGATLDKSDSMTLRVEYEGEARKDYQSQTGSLKAVWNF